MFIAFTFVECNDTNIGMVFLPALPYNVVGSSTCYYYTKL